MTIRPFIPYSDRRLHVPAEPVQAITETVRMIWDDMIDTMDAMPAEGIYPYIALFGAAYWFAYFLIILPILGIIEKSDPMPATIEEDFKAHYGQPTHPAE